MNSEKFVNYYVVLGLTPKAGQKQIAAAYATLAKQSQQPSGQLSRRLMRIEAAYACLSNKQLRAAYNIEYATAQKLKMKRLHSEDKLAADIKRQARANAVTGLVVLLAGAIIAGMSLMWPALPKFLLVLAVVAGLVGLYTFLAGMYHYFYTYPIMRTAIGAKFAARFQSTRRAGWAISRVGGMAGTLLVLLYVGFIFAQSRTSAPKPAPIILPAAGEVTISTTHEPAGLGASLTVNPPSSLTQGTVVTATPKLTVRPAQGGQTDIQIVPASQVAPAMIVSSPQPVTPTPSPDPTPTPTPTPTPNPSPTPSPTPTPAPSPTPTPVPDPTPTPTPTPSPSPTPSPDPTPTPTPTQVPVI